jgi:integrase/recombinase XerC
MKNLALAGGSFLSQSVSRDLVAELVADKRSHNTQRAYVKDLRDFFSTMTGQEPSPAVVASFLQLDRFSARAIVLNYKAQLIERGLSEATVNRRLSAIKSLVNHACMVGLCDWSLVDIKGEKVRTYRDTTGITPEEFKLMLAVCERHTLPGKRDYAILCLLWDNSLRRGELVKTNIKDFDPEAKKLTIIGKGRGTQSEKVSLTTSTVAALQDWLDARGVVSPLDPLFISLNRVCPGHRLDGSSIDRIVSTIALAAGIKKRISPHRLRHSSITAFLDASGGNIRAAQRLSRHAKLDTLRIYDDNRQDMQGEASDLLASLRV